MSEVVVQIGIKARLKNMSMISKAWKNMVLLLLTIVLLPLCASASEVQQISIEDTSKGDVLHIKMDEPLEYQVFDLDGPPRLVLTFPGADMDSGVMPLKNIGKGVSSVYPVKNKDGVRVEISMSQMLHYSIDEEKNGLAIRFDSPLKTGGHQTNTAVIKDIEVQDRGSATELILRGDNMNANHNEFMTENKKQMIIDYWGASSQLIKENFKYATQRIKSVTVGQAKDRVRLVVTLLPTSNMQQQVEASANQLVLRIGKIGVKRKASVAHVENVSFKPEDRIAHLIVRTDVTNPVVDIHQKDDNIIIDMKKAQLMPGQERSQDVSAFPGPLKQVDSYPVDDSVRIVARLRDKVQVTSFQQGNILTINFEPEDMALARKGSSSKEEFAYTGQKVSFDFKDIDIRNALKLIAEMSDLNIIMSDDVKGTLTMRLIDVPWDQALDLILTARGLGQEKTGNVLRIAPIEVLRSEYQAKLEARQGSQQLEPLITEFITLSYTKVADVKKMLEGASANASKGGSTTTGAAGDTGGGATAGASAETSIGILSPRGSFLIDERTNTLIVKDTESAINNIKRLIATIDKPVQQVLIEARIVEATDSFTRDLGVSWGGAYTQRGGKNFLNVSPVGTSLNNGTVLMNGTGTLQHGMMVDLPAAIGAGLGGGVGLSIGSLSGKILDLQLSAAELDNKVKIISNPRISTTNLKPAYIKQGVKVGVTTPGTANSPPTTTLVDALLQLQVTPQITADNGVIMDVVVSKNTPTTFNNTTGIDTKEVSTNIYMKNGETVVIGGVYTRDQTNTTNGVPALSRLPLLGWLFKKNYKQDNRTELLIFMTPKIMSMIGGDSAATANR